MPFPEMPFPEEAVVGSAERYRTIVAHRQEIAIYCQEYPDIGLELH
jgi:hypothetical protein